MRSMIHTPMAEVLTAALDGGYVVPAFNVWTYQEALALVQAANTVNSPLILQTSSTCLAHNGLELSYQMVATAANRAKVPVVVHLDHAKELPVIEEAIQLGYSGVMFDGSHLSFDENVEYTKQTMRIAQTTGATVEAEIGHVVKGENDKEVLTDAKEAQDFLALTGVKALAVAVGTRHGMQKREAPINHEAVNELSAKLAVPLVLHGSSGVSDSDLPLLCPTGVCKVNIATRLRLVFIKAMAQLAPEYAEADHIRLLMGAHEQTQAEAEHIFSLLNCVDRA